MPKLFSILFAVLVICSGNHAAKCQGRSSVETLVLELQNTATSSRAADQLRQLAKSSPGAQRYLGGHLPGLIANSLKGPVWLNAVRLAGELKLSESVPILTQCLAEDNHGGSTTFAESARLDDDAVGKALVEIGEPATRAVGELLEKGEAASRLRAALVLSNVNSPEAKRLLAAHLQHESDPHVKDVIEAQLMQQRQ